MISSSVFLAYSINVSVNRSNWPALEQKCTIFLGLLVSVNLTLILGLCDKMWGDAFYYEESNMNCMVMKFDPQNNPNLYGNCEHNLAKRSKSSGLSSSQTTLSMDLLCILLALCVQTLVFLKQ